AGRSGTPSQRRGTTFCRAGCGSDGSRGERRSHGARNRLACGEGVGPARWRGDRPALGQRRCGAHGAVRRSSARLGPNTPGVQGDHARGTSWSCTQLYRGAARAGCAGDRRATRETMTLTLPPDAQFDQLIHHSDPEVLVAVAGDARLSEDLALALLERRDLPRQALEQMYKHKSLARLRKVQLALVMHPRTPRHVSIPVIRHLYAFELMQVALLPSVLADVKRAAEEALIGRLATVSSGERFTLAKQSSGRVAATLLLDKEARVMRAALDNGQMTEL